MQGFSIAKNITSHFLGIILLQKYKLLRAQFDMIPETLGDKKCQIHLRHTKLQRKPIMDSLLQLPLTLKRSDLQCISCTKCFIFNGCLRKQILEFHSNLKCIVIEFLIAISINFLTWHFFGFTYIHSIFIFIHIQNTNEVLHSNKKFDFFKSSYESV